MSTSSLRLQPADLIRPLDVDAVFGRSGPLVVEIGFGNGTFFRDLAHDHPDWNLLGVEIATASVTRGLAMIRREGLEHVRLYCGDGHFLVRQGVTPGGLHRLYLNFPDPWPKERHQHRRLLQAPFFRLLSTRLDPDAGEFWFTTDHQEYFEFALGQADETGLFDVTTGTPPAAALQTKYARRWQEESKAIHHAVFRPRRADADAHSPVLEEADVAHARFEGDLDAIEGFEKQTHRDEGGTVVVLDAARTLDGARLLFEVIVDEPALRQEILLEARTAESGAVYLELLGFGRPATTPLVSRAVDHVADWLEGKGLRRIES